MTIEAAIQIAQSVLPYLYVALAVFITMHVLRHKSDPRSSLLWIALVWFSPLLGAVLYFMFGINRISRRAQKLGVADNGNTWTGENSSVNLEPDNYWQGFCHLGNRLTHVERLGGNHIEILEGVDNIHNAMIDAINGARTHIFLTTFIFKNDDIGKRVIDALGDARARDVDILISLDGFGNIIALSRAYWALKKRGITVKRFLHSYWPWRMPYLNLRNHRKILLIDDSVAFTGSANIGRVPNLETHFKIQGPVLDHLQSAFLENWSMSTSAQILPPNPTVLPEPAGELIARGIKSGPAYPIAKTRTIISGALNAASKRIRIVTPYFIPDRVLLSDIELAALRGVEVEVILPRRSNHRYADWAGRRQLKTLLQTGCKIYMRDGDFDHSKLMVVDDRWCLLGSSNWDSRSLRLNFEFDIECASEAFVHKLNKVIDAKRDASERMPLDWYKGRNGFVVLRDSAARLLLPYL